MLDLSSLVWQIHSFEFLDLTPHIARSYFMSITKLSQKIDNSIDFEKFHMLFFHILC